MKLTELHEEVLVEHDGTRIKFKLEEAGNRVSFSVDSGGGKVKGKGLATVPNDSLAVGTLVGLATHEIRKRFVKRRHTVHFFAKDHDERRLYKKLVDDLLKTGLYVKKRETMASGGILWELMRKS